MTSAAPNPNQANQPPQLQINNATSPPNRRDLKSWWKGFKLPSKHQDPQETRSQGIFGVPLRQSITYANVAISLIDEHGKSYIYGYVPIVVAKCGVFLKEKATGIEGIFRLSGSEKRIKELKTIFDSPDRYGKGLVWDGYTVHDAANVLRRYLNDLPEPVVPLDLYEKFRDPLRGATKQAVGDLEGPQFVDNFNEKAAIERYQRLITELPPLNRQLLLYILDLLAVFAAKADENRMNSQNLAAIFQPGMLSHPAHAMAPEEYRLNQCVIIFLIENQDHFLIGMQGTAADEKTKKEVESGTPSAPLTPNPNRTSSLDRSASNASAGAASVRRDGKLRRNRSVSSRNSRNDGTSTPNSPALTATPTTGGLARSNTVPSKKSPALAGGRFQRQDGSGPRSPAHLEPLTQLNAGESVDQSPQSTRSTDISGSGHLTPTRAPVTGRSQERLLDVPQEAPTPTKERNLPSIFRGLPSDSGRQPNKLKKKRIPGSLNPSAHSSSASLSYTHQTATSPNFELPNPMEHPQQHEQEQHLLSQQPQSQTPAPIQEERHREHLEQQQDRLHGLQHPQETQLTPPASLVQQKSDVSSEHTPRASQASSNQSLHPDNTLKSKKSPPTSLHSSFNEGSDLDQVLDEQSITTIEQAEKEKKKRWRLSRSKNADNGASTPSGLTSPRMVLGINENADVSNLSISSSSHRPRKSESSDRPVMIGDAHSSFDSGRDNDSKGPIGWIRNKYREAKESADARRNKSPPADRTNLSATSFSPRGKSLDIKRDGPREGEKQASSPPAQHASLAAAPAAASTIAAAVGPTFAPAPSAAPVPQPATITLVNQGPQQQPRPSQTQAQPKPPSPQQYQAQAQHQSKPQPQPEPQPQHEPQQPVSPPAPQPAVTQTSAPAPAPDPAPAPAPTSVPAAAPAPQSPQPKEPQDLPQPQPEQQQEKKPEEKPVQVSEQPQSPQTQPPHPQSEPTKQEQ
ncbi:uncharacterized protein NECHADRAFT_105042 [Fusarium vanettenii 77-13-4]|uniref:Rho-GAP domain-containing protein n=1 Tax=Fusarium vanettenii (strain ATCC MYA-4622 / CBS 123669 / FGSC 9596 / NRRL 45880 / 77-13-4) TaxID=660122 RepID=C7YYQ2_FUSV7|nr:uncharacterized protein NECHADRAFT_105042 [Fusarium vanettenii 77-13-4]EEU43232.1 hypothetical protein NECHADRAFT_105042 [Fusarium vanettenii 77-13-4]